MEELSDSSTLMHNLQLHSPYIQEIRSKIFSVIIFFIMGSVLGFIFNEKIISFGLQLFDLKGVNVVMTSPFQFVGLSFTISFIVGFITAIPILVIQGLKFIKPALHKDEYNILIKAIPWSILLFLVGFAFGLWIMQFIIHIYANSASTFNVGNYWDIQKLFSTMLITATCLGVIFQFPLVFTYLLKFGFIEIADLQKKRPFFYAILMLFVVLLPPVDIFSDIILIAPMLLLFELTLLLNYKKRGGEVYHVK